MGNQMRGNVVALSETGLLSTSFLLKGRPWLASPSLPHSTSRQRELSALKDGASCPC